MTPGRGGGGEREGMGQSQQRPKRGGKCHVTFLQFF